MKREMERDIMKREMERDGEAKGDEKLFVKVVLNNYF